MLCLWGTYLMFRRAICPPSFRVCVVPSSIGSNIIVNCCACSLLLAVQSTKAIQLSLKAVSYPLAKLCAEDPLSVSRNFSQKFHHFFNTVILNGAVLGTVTHHFYKKEYQSRGAPHYHMLLRIEGAPVAGADDEVEVLWWIQERITCHIPEEESNPELHQLVTKYQYHKCSKYCQRRKRVKGGTFITCCRFGFQTETCETASLFLVEECMKLAHRKIYKLPRSPKEIRINNYDPLLLMLWKAMPHLSFAHSPAI